MNDAFLWLFLAVLVLAFFAGPVALVWCIVLARDARRLRDELSDVRIRLASAEPVQRASAPVPPAATAAPAPPPAPAPAPAEEIVAERREAVREALRQIHEPPPPPPPAPPPPPNEPASARPSWEHWLGVRAAAALGAIVLVIAGLYLFRYSIEKGLLTPVLRVALGTALGTACLAASETVLRRRFAPLAHWIAGAGIALLYVSFWAAAARYALLPLPVSSALMILVTAVSVLLAVKRQALAVALLGLVGGFATPILLSTGSDRPIALFSYLFVLDVALLYVARVRRWPALALLSLVGTSLYQGLWIVARMGPDRLALGVGILLAFGVLYAFGAKKKQQEEQPLWGLTRVATIVAPFLFALYFGLDASVSERFLLPGAYLGVIVLGAVWYSARDEGDWLGVGATAAGLGALAAWLATHAPSARSAWEVMGVQVVVAVALGALTGRERERASWALPVWSLGALVLSCFWAASAPALEPWPWLVGMTALAFTTLGFALQTRRDALSLLALGGLGAALALIRVVRVEAPRAELELLALLGTGVVVGLTGLVTGRGERRLPAHGAAAFFTLLLAGHALLSADVALPAWQLFGAAVLLGTLLAFAGLASRASGWFVVAVLLTAAVCARFAFGLELAQANLVHALGIHALAVVAFVGWALALPRHARESAWTWRAAALVGPAFFLPTRHLFVSLYGDGAIALLPLALAVLCLGAATLVCRRGPSEADARRTALVWLGAVALSFVTVAIPLQLRNEWVTIGWALQGVALFALWRRLDHVGLKYFAVALLAAVTVRLISNPAVLDYHERGPLPVLNWLSYTYLVPAACAFAAFALLRPMELARRSALEREWLPERLGPVLARALGFFGIAIVFVWLNLTIIDWYSVGPTLSVALEHQPARDLTLSVAWALYALVLLAVGVWRTSTGLRALSLALVLVTCGKVFLYDLSHLADLYRVASLAGLALSLILVSLAYQRFVFRDTDWRMHAS